MKGNKERNNHQGSRKDLEVRTTNILEASYETSLLDDWLASKKCLDSKGESGLADSKCEAKTS